MRDAARLARNSPKNEQLYHSCFQSQVKSSKVKLPTHFHPSNICEHVSYRKLLKKSLPWAYESVTSRARPPPTPATPQIHTKAVLFLPLLLRSGGKQTYVRKRKNPSFTPPSSLHASLFFAFFSSSLSAAPPLPASDCPQGDGEGGGEQELDSDMNSLQNCF